MSQTLFKDAYEGAIIALGYAKILLDKALQEYGPEAPIAYPDTAYKLPVMLSLSGEEVTKLGDLPPILSRVENQYLREALTFENAKLAGEATLYAAEVIEAIKYVNGNDPYAGDYFTGFLNDRILRKFGVPLVDFTIPGVAVIVGKARSTEELAAMIKDLQSKGMMLMLCNEVIEQCIEAGIKLGTDYIAFPLGDFTQVIHAVNFALRAGLAFGGIKPGRREEMLDYQARRVRAFVLFLGELDQVRIAAGFGAIDLGFPCITDQDLEEELPDWFVTEKDYKKMVQVAMELRGIKLKIVDIPVPVTIGPAFEGESIRKKDMYVEFGGGRKPGFELVRMMPLDDVEDHKIELIGPDVDQMEEGKAYPIGIIVDVAGRKMQEDFEPVLERRIHYFINYGEGLWHVAQRDLCWLRISKGAYEKGFRMKHFGEILYAKFKSEFPAIVDRVQVTIITDEEKVVEMREVAREKYAKRDARLRELTDEGVDTFYSCTLCQSFAPTHVCVVAPERVGLCGAVSWLDAKAAYEINPHGANQPIPKGECEDPIKGRWKSFDEFIFNNSQRTIEHVNFYTIMEYPMTSCGCFEAILAIVPELNGIMVVNREHAGETPCGMTFSTLAGTCGGGAQLPGFMGIGKSYMLSKKFIPADGGLARIVWMPKELKEQMREQLAERAEELGLGRDFVDKIADETVGTTPDEILPFLEEKGHPALTMDPLF
ncbi:MAG: acetyl-CoA decarbonylase/synthase complex subunit alpha/beta [Bacillota bacterium]|uniref:CO-methylating acetyl-CoA synthase n=2 Tax=Carboxydocella TaxID=178898 RepID=A0A1T4QS33_9FIRM|nr:MULTISPECIES: acetyl-CoA decarbonylase/synthase complex subunit alpha/beta [Carboxydocella]AVX20840.1 acetyl-CoA decarbonylase/synthase complex subunit alpha/beta [Carboxydocella thermautotrophica]AVX31259.1 acetyl-CoA decarbonylase/synthase complex subunit alpha/beta [Carboxydocella thermautotrophica]SKA06301.1 acetyl-CoA decarbonylase/synthase beta subunit [Carboxydocella sporoproducens DSM 16521]GAW29990.1 bifunctional acetyl-CoA decarbonylase/synthase complex subunit alpha/beta [Carboxyd